MRHRLTYLYTYLGIGKAVRNAVDEVHKRAQEIRDAPTPSPPRIHQQRRSQSSLGPYALQDRVKTLEDRNKQLAKLLEGALNELWDYQKRVARKNANTEGSADPPDVEDLNIAIAKVQFVQVHLDDPKLILLSETSQTGDIPHAGRIGNEEPEAEGARNDHPLADTADIPASLQGPISESTDPVASSHPPTQQIYAADLADPSTFEEFVPLPATSGTEIPEIVIEDNSKESNSSTVAVHPLTEQKRSTSRPRLDQSPYSWMLGEQDASATPFNRASSSASERGRNRGFLFGADPEESNRTEGKPTPNETFDLGALRHGKR